MKTKTLNVSHRKLLVAAAISTAAFIGTGHGQLLNGSFEDFKGSATDETYPGWIDKSNMNDWTENYNNQGDGVAEVYKGGIYAPSDKNALLILGNSLKFGGSSVTQTFAIGAGQEFTITLDNSLGGIYNNKSGLWENEATGGTFEVKVSGASFAGFTDTAKFFAGFDSGSPTNPGKWETYTSGIYNTGKDTSLDITITSFATSKDADNLALGFFDNVNVNVVPEPTSALLFGLGGMAALLRRRRP